MVVEETNRNNIIAGMDNAGGVKLHNHKRKLKQRFDIIKKLGQGTYGKVQLGINKATGEEVAIKTIKKCKIETEADLIRIRREIQIMSSVQHPNIIHIFEVFENKEKMVLVMEYAAGGELYDYLSKKKILSENEARRIFRQIATAVFYCHKHQICHRDLKLENILLDQNGDAKIADFGLSNVFDKQRLLSTFCGSPLYASPEIVKGTPYNGPEVDCWSLGVLLYTLVYGAMPFDGSDFKKLVKQITQSDYYEPKKNSTASSLIKEMLTVSSSHRANIEQICNHWWINEGYEKNCMHIAEDLAAATPVRLDLLLTLIPQQPQLENFSIDNHKNYTPIEMRKINSEPVIFKPVRCYSTGSIMEINKKSDNDIMRNRQFKPVLGSDLEKKLFSINLNEKDTSITQQKKGLIKDKTSSEIFTTPVISYTNHLELSSSFSAAGNKNLPVKSPYNEKNNRDEKRNLISYAKFSRNVAIPKKENVKKKRTKPKERQSLKAEQSDEFNGDHKMHKNNEISFHVTNSTKCSEIPKNITSGSRKNLINKKKHQELLFCSEEDSCKLDNSKKNNYSHRLDCNILEQNITSGPNDILKKKMKNRTFSLDSGSKRFTSKVQAQSINPKIIFNSKQNDQSVFLTDMNTHKYVAGVKTDGVKNIPERKDNFSSSTATQSAENLAVDFNSIKQIVINEKLVDKQCCKEEKKIVEERKRAVDIIKEALGRPPTYKKYVPESSSQNINSDSSQLHSLPSTDCFKILALDNNQQNEAVSIIPENKRCTKLEITLKNATLPRSRKTSKAEIILKDSNPLDESYFNFNKKGLQSEIKKNTRTENTFSMTKSKSQGYSSKHQSEKENNSKTFGHMIPFNVPHVHQTTNSVSKLTKAFEPHRSKSHDPTSQSLNSTISFDLATEKDTSLRSETIKKSPKEYIIPIIIESGDYVARNSNVRLLNKNIEDIYSNENKRRIPMKSELFFSDVTSDVPSFFSLKRNSDSLLHKHIHRLVNSRPTQKAAEYADSLSSGDDDDDDDGFELLTAENLFSTLLSRVKCLTRRLNSSNLESNSFPDNQLLKKFEENSFRKLWKTNEDLFW